MSDEEICTCGFADGCPTFNDRLIGRRQKGPTGRGCQKQTDTYRQAHCQAFAHGRLARAFSNSVRAAMSRPPEGARREGPAALSRGECRLASAITATGSTGPVAIARKGCAGNITYGLYDFQARPWPYYHKVIPLQYGACDGQIATCIPFCG